MKYSIRYGTYDQFFDVSDIVMKKCLVNNSFIVIDKCDLKRDQFFGDPALYVSKYIWIYCNKKLQYKVDGYHIVFINLISNEIKEFVNDSQVQDEIMNFRSRKIDDLLLGIELLFGNFSDNNSLKWTNKYQFYLEYIKSEDNVLQVGSNFGRDSLVLDKLVGCEHHVVVEYYKDVVPLLEKYKVIYNSSYSVESGILSLKPTVRKEIFLIRSDTLFDEMTEFIKCLTLDELEKKYDTTFNILIFNCSGFFYYILRDFDHLLDNVTTIILENDILIIEHKQWVRNYLEKKQFRMMDSLDRNLTEFSGKEFYQVWIRI